MAMTEGTQPGRDDRPCSQRARAALGRGIGLTAVAMLLLLASTVPAEAQRAGRRWRSPPPAPRAPSTPRPSPPAGTGAAAPPRTASPQGTAPKPPLTAGKPEGKNAPTTDKKTGQDASQATASPTPGLASPLASSGADRLDWDGPTPFSEAWRADHPGAWRPQEGAGEIVLAGGARVPTRVEAGVAEVAQWTARDRQPEGAAPQSVLRASAEEALPEDGIPPGDLVVFPGAEGGLAASAEPEPKPSAPAEVAAPDGTVSVLVRDGAGPSSGPAPAAGASATVSLSQDESSSPWLPLGTFAAVPAGSDRALAPHLFLELALHRDGTVRGNYFDAVSDAVHPVTGRFDRETGTLSWRVGSAGAEFETTAEGLSGGRGEASVRRGKTVRPWVLIALP